MSGDDTLMELALSTGTSSRWSFWIRLDRRVRIDSLALWLLARCGVLVVALIHWATVHSYWPVLYCIRVEFCI
jgi:hypothetical protein